MLYTEIVNKNNSFKKKKINLIETLNKDNNKVLLETEAFYYSLRDKIEAELRELSSLTMDELLEQRYQHFRKIGRPMA